MKISFEQTGGIAGLRFAATVDTAALSEQEAAKLRQLVDAADLFHLPGRIVSPRPQPDRFQYRLQVREGGRQHTVTVSEDAMPAALAPLIRWLVEEVRRKSQEKGS